MITLTAFILVLGFLISIHELGHFFAAKIVGVDVEKFSIGFPPEIASKSIKGTKYVLSLIPLGGYVQLKGQNIDDENPDEENNYAAKSVYQRLFILIAGAMMNLAAAFIFTPLSFYIGQEVPAFLFDPPIVKKVAQNSNAQKVGIRDRDRIIAINRHSVRNWQETQKALMSSQAETVRLLLVREGKRVELSFDTTLLFGKQAFGWSFFLSPVIGDVVKSLPADRAGIQPGDILMRIGNEPIDDWSQITSAISKSNGQEIEIQFLRNGVRKTTSLIPYRNRQDDRWIIGVSSKTVRVSETIPNALVNGIQWVGQVTQSTFEFLYKLVVGQASSKSIGGPIMIAQMIGEATERGVSELLQLVAFISLQLCIFNLLPIPALDGGHILLLLIEKMKGSSLSKGFRIGVQKAGFVLLITLITLVLIQDGFRVFGNI